MERNFLIIPDVHGRSFWHRAVEGRENERIIFLGDYLDPYPWDDIAMGKATKELRSIIDFKKNHSDNVVLLLGNHDLGYIDRQVCECRMEYMYELVNRRIILENIDLFSLVHEVTINERPVLFSHAGLREKWILANRSLFQSDNIDPIVLNDMFHDDLVRPSLLKALSQCSFYRGGIDNVSSPIWADMDELADTDDLYPGYLHVFGHTLHKGGPLHVCDNGWCLDCAMAFTMTENFTFHPIL